MFVCVLHCPVRLYFFFCIMTLCYLCVLQNGQCPFWVVDYYAMIVVVHSDTVEGLGLMSKVLWFK